jgi:hypothetical protein
MRVRSYSLILVSLLVLIAAASPALAQATASTAASPTDPAKVEAFLKSLGDAISIDNPMRVASFVKYPLEAWVDGEKLTLRSDSQLFAHYRQIFDESLKQSLATARAASFTQAPQGVAVCGGRLIVGQASEKNASLKIVKIGEPATR